MIVLPTVDGTTTDEIVVDDMQVNEAAHVVPPIEPAVAPPAARPVRRAAQRFRDNLSKWLKLDAI